MTIKFLSAAVLVVLGAGSVMAAPESCEFTKWKGAKKDIAQSWTGTGFAIRNAKSGMQASTYYDKKATKWFAVETKTASDFKTYVFRDTRSAAAGKIVQIRRSYRVYDSGKCKAFVEAKGFRPIIANGEMK